MGWNCFPLSFVSKIGHYAEAFPHLHAQFVGMSIQNNSDTQELLALIGEDAFTRLCMVFGGTRLHISNSDRSLQRLSVITGADLAEKLISHYQGTAISLPKLSSIEIAKRHQAIADDMEKGMSTRDAAIKYDMTERNIRKIRAKF